MIGRRRLRCSFCGRDEAAVAKLVAGPRTLLIGRRVHICNRCVEMAQKIMSQPRDDGPAALTV